MMGQICVRVLNDRLRPEGPYSVPIPVVETGRTNRQYVTLQNAGRDEVKPTIVAEMDPISPRQEEWQKLRGELRSEITQAYAVAADATRPQVFFQIVPHRDVEVVGARISLAETMLILDEHGAYRAAAAFHMNNATEQFLEVELPAGAALWTAVVDNQPVKPIEDPKAAKGRRVLIPLVKTAAGDLDYIVTLKYGGQTAALGNFSAVNFPLVHAKNINAERSVVQLHLPAAYQWLDFGGTMHPGEEGDVTAAVLSYQTKQAQRLMETVRGKDPFAQQRAMNNLKALDASVMQYRQQVGNLIAGNRSAQAEAVVNCRRSPMPRSRWRRAKTPSRPPRPGAKGPTAGGPYRWPTSWSRRRPPAPATSSTRRGPTWKSPVARWHLPRGPRRSRPGSSTAPG